MKPFRTLRRTAVATMLLALYSAGTVLAHDDHAGHAASAAAPVKRTEASYQPAAVSMQRQDGKATDFRQMLDDGRPVLLNFIFTSCTAICPVTSQVFSEVRERLGKDRDRVNMVSVSIDPENDTPRRLVDYAERFNAGGSWNFFTGTAQDSIALQKSFKAYQGDKMNHVPVTFLRAAPGKPWVRLEGFSGPGVLMAELRATAPW